jgi:hypothetical protein
MRMNGFTDIGRLAPHLDRQADFADEIARVRPYNAATDEAMRCLIEQELGKPLVTPIGDRTA